MGGDEGGRLCGCRSDGAELTEVKRQTTPSREEWVSQDGLEREPQVTGPGHSAGSRRRGERGCCESCHRACARLEEPASHQAGLLLSCRAALLGASLEGRCGLAVSAAFLGSCCHAAKPLPGTNTPCSLLSPSLLPSELLCSKPGQMLSAAAHPAFPTGPAHGPLSRLLLSAS